MIDNIFNNRQKLAIFFSYVVNNRLMMKNYKFFLIILSLIFLVGFLVITYLDMPAPDKLETKILDVNDEKIK
jgi:hypothetical protein